MQQEAYYYDYDHEENPLDDIGPLWAYVLLVTSPITIPSMFIALGICSFTGCKIE